MSKKNETPKNSVPNKRKTPALYRKLETFALDLTKRVDGIPNKPMLSQYVSRLSNELVDCLASTRYAYSTQDYRIRYEYLQDMEVHLDLIKTIIDVLFEYASTSTTRFMTPEHHSKYLLDLDDIERQRNSWAQSTYKSIDSCGFITPEKSLSPAQALPPVTPDLNCNLDIPENAQFMPLGGDRYINNL